MKRLRGFSTQIIMYLKVLTWLLSAEDGLQGQPAISNNVEEVKEQFHTHEVSGTSRDFLFLFIVRVVVMQIAYPQ